VSLQNRNIGATINAAAINRGAQSACALIAAGHVCREWCMATTFQRTFSWTADRRPSAMSIRRSLRALRRSAKPLPNETRWADLSRVHTGPRRRPATQYKTTHCAARFKGFGSCGVTAAAIFTLTLFRRGRIIHGRHIATTPASRHDTAWRAATTGPMVARCLQTDGTNRLCTY